MAIYPDSVKYQSVGVGINAAPKELGILQRADGLRTGLQSLRSRLESFSDRLDGNGTDKAANGLAPVASSLNGTFSDLESELRQCLQLVDSINDRF